MSFFAVGNDELENAEPVRLGDKIICPHCQSEHALEGGVDSKTGEVSDLLMFYKCGKSSYLAGVSGKLVPRFKIRKVVDA